MSGMSKRSIRVPEEVQERSRRGPEEVQERSRRGPEEVQKRSRRGPEEVQEKSTRGPGEDQWRSRGGPGEVQEKSWRSRRFKGSRYLGLDNPRDSRGLRGPRCLIVPTHLIFINGSIFKDQYY